MDQSELKSCFSGHTLKETNKNLWVSPREYDGKKLAWSSHSSRFLINLSRAYPISYLGSISTDLGIIFCTVLQ